ncbi:peptidase [Lacibacter luteus]|uniref:Peptidase n=1 Tax=Lacibacter luteus TaxID=2508719 RepID=A0A4Q1CFT0_9BACT|nr:M90 family metallopeptidase [Lacibacter luteus]RXK58882.1 peptidase [Lacibacter luteus]
MATLFLYSDRALLLTVMLNSKKDYLHQIMVLVFQIIMALLLILFIILITFRIGRPKLQSQLPVNYKELLTDYVKFYQRLDEAGKEAFEKRVEQFLATVKITGINAEVEDLDRILLAAGAVIPVFAISDWQYMNLHEVLVYPGAFNSDFEQHGADRNIAGMVGTGPLQNVMVITKWQLRQGFINTGDNRNTAIHEFVHLVDKMDGTTDGVPEIILERKYAERWKMLMEETIVQMKTNGSDIDLYAATNTAEFFAVVSEYFFEQPELLKLHHPHLFEMLEQIFHTGKLQMAEQ